MCFTVKAASGVARVRFDTQKTIEITDNEDQQVPRDLDNGFITIQGNVQPPAIATPAQVTNVNCFGASTGAINITVSGGSGNYTYKWSYQNASTQDLTNLPAGNYTVTVTDAVSTLTATQSYTVTQPATAVQVVSVTPTPVACFGQSSGSLAVVAQGGTGTLSYAWSGGLPAIANPTGVAAGTYTVTVTDANGCQAVSSATSVTQPQAALTVNATTENAACAGLNNGQISISASGGTSPYTYAWSNNLPANQTTQSNLAPGSYRVTVTDARGCTISTTAQVGQGSGVSIVSIQPTFIDAGSDGAVNIGVSGGTTPYQFSWSGPQSFSRTTEDITGLNTTGQYCITVTDSKGCLDTACAMVLQKLKFGAVTVQEACFGESNGSVTVNATGGQSPYSFKWSNGATSQNLSSLSAGAYGLTITDALNTSISGSFQVPGLSAIVINGNTTDAVGSANAANGSIVLNVTGGQSNYQYKWSTGATTSSINGLKKGEYCVTVTDDKNCSAVKCFQVNLVALPLAFNAQVFNNRCFGQSQGRIVLTVNGGLEPYFATFNDGTRINSVAGLIERNNLPVGVFTYVITDNEGSTIQGSSTITQPTAIALAQTVVRHDTDVPGCTGSISITPTGGTGSFNVRWNSNNAGVLISNLCEGNYISNG
ncbi:MAG: SprB repeat-containing protein [Haliscomenobacter sp.]|nr:SprB repeat-containing protein [Haliscomenobacter sp.]